MKEQQKDIRIRPLSQLMKIEFPPVEWLVDKLVPVSSVIGISGYPASYKTWFILDLALKVAKGETLFDKFKTGQTGVLLVDEENGERSLQKRFNILKAESSDLPLYWTSLNEFKLTKDTVDYLIKSANEKGVGLIIFDSLVRIHESDENSSREMAKVASLLKRFTKNDIAVIFTHHNRKPSGGQSNPAQDMRGSSDLLASIEVHIALSRKVGGRVVTVTQTKIRDGEESKPFQLELISDKEHCHFQFNGTVQDKKDEVIEAIKETLKTRDNLLRKELFECIKALGVNVGNSTFSMATKEMILDEELFERKGSGNSTYYSLKPFSENE